MAMPEHIGKTLQSLKGSAEENSRKRDFKEALDDCTLSRAAQTLAMAEGINPGKGHEEVLKTFLNLGGVESEYDPARWELLREGYPVNRGW